MQKHFTLLILLLFFVNLHSQNNEISFKRYSVAESKGYQINIKETNKELYIEAILKDSISKNLEFDKDYIKLNKKINKNPTDKKVVLKTLSKLQKLYDKHTYSKTDFIVLDKEKFPEYYNQFNEILNTPTSVLNKKNRDRLVLDSHTVKFVRKTKDYQDFFTLISPNESSNPVIVKFMKATFEVFRNENKNEFLDRKYTFGL